MVQHNEDDEKEEQTDQDGQASSKRDEKESSEIKQEREEEKKPKDKLSGYPETVEFSGIGRTSLLQVHISAGLIILVGVIIALNTGPAGLLLLIAFLIFVLAAEMWMIRRSEKKLRMVLCLREDPVEAYSGNFKVGLIDHGSINTSMDAPNELGYRPAPNKPLIVWTFDSREDKEVTAKRLLEYLPKDSEME